MSWFRKKRDSKKANPSLTPDTAQRGDNKRARRNSDATHSSVPKVRHPTKVTTRVGKIAGIYLMTGGPQPLNEAQRKELSTHALQSLMVSNPDFRRNNQRVKQDRPRFYQAFLQTTFGQTEAILERDFRGWLGQRGVTINEAAWDTHYFHVEKTVPSGIGMETRHVLVYYHAPQTAPVRPPTGGSTPQRPKTRPPKAPPAAAEGDWKAVATFTGHEKRVSACAFFPDASQLVSGSGDKMVRTWDVESSEPRLHLTGHTGLVGCVAVSPDGRLIASGSSDGTIRLWEEPTGAEARVISAHGKRRVSCLAFSPDGSLLVSGGGDSKVRVWEVATGELLHDITGRHPGLPVEDCAFSTDGLQVLSISYKGLVTFNMDSERTITATTQGGGGCLQTFSPDGSLLAGGGSSSLTLHDAATGVNMHGFMNGHTDSVHALAWSRSGALLLSASADATLRLWSVKSGLSQAVIVGHKGAVYSCAFSPDGGLVASGGQDKTACVWRLG